MNLNDNIKNAFTVVRNTHKNIEKLMKYCDNISEKNGYASVTEKFLRYKSDKYVEGWLLDGFVKLYQNLSDNDFENEWKNGPVFVFEINLDKEPIINISMFLYNDIENWETGISPRQHWAFYCPVNLDMEGIEKSLIDEAKQIYLIDADENVSNNYWSLNRIYTLSYKLTDLNSETTNKLVFKNFDLLNELFNK